MKHFSDIIDVGTYRSDSGSMMAVLCPKSSIYNNVRYRRPPQLKQMDVTVAYTHNQNAALLDENTV